MKISRPDIFKNRLAEILLIIAFILVSVFYFKDARRVIFKYSNPDELNFYDLKFDIVKKLIPARSIIGYLSDTNPHLSMMRFYYATYALSPIVVVKGTDYPSVVCDFSDKNKFADVVREGNFEIISPLCEGIALLRRR